MIRITSNKAVSITNTNGEVTTLYQQEIFCNSTDSKPTENLANGSMLVEVDTGYIYIFDEVAKTWTKMN